MWLADPLLPTCALSRHRNGGCVLRKQAEAVFFFSFFFPGWVAGLIGRWLLATQDSFNKNTSRFTLIIHRPRLLATATGAIKQCSSVNESTIWSSYLFVNSECPALVVITAAGVLMSRCFSVMLSITSKHMMKNHKKINNNLTLYFN